MGRDLLGDEDEALAREQALVEAERIEAAQEEDFGAFWDAQDRKPTTLRNVFGVDVTLPAALPLRFEVEAKKVAASDSEADTKRMVGILFGDGALERWTEAGMDLEQFAVLLMWGTVNTRRPNSLTLAEARTAYLERAQGKALALPEGTSGGASSGTGPRSKPISRASTASRKRK